MGNSTSKSDVKKSKSTNEIRPVRERQNYSSQFSLSSFVGNLSGRSFLSVASNQSFSSRPLSRVSRRRWNTSTLNDPLLASKTAWPVPHVEALFLPEFKVSSDIHDRKFEILETISKGAYGKVYKIKKVETGEILALKVLSKAQIISENAIRQVKDEVHIQEVCGHNPFIVSCLLKWQSKRRLYIVTEYIPGGELFTLLNKYIRLPEELVRVYVAEISVILDFLHNAGVVFRDLKPENLLLTSLGHIRLIDFGLSKWLKFGCRTTTICGTLQYLGDIFCNRNGCFLKNPRMNARSQVFSLSMEGRQVDEALASIFHTVLFHRSYGKFLYSNDINYSIGTVGYTDVDCDFIDFTYVCCSSKRLDKTVRREISGFSDSLRNIDGSATGQISLEFFQKRRRWPFQPESIPWEVWTVRLELINLHSEDERQVYREKVGEMLQDKVFYITDVMNRHEYVPKMPSSSDLDLIFDTSYDDIQPYLFKVNYSLAGPPVSSVGNTMKKLIKETLAL